MPRARLQPALARVRLLRAQVVVVLVGLRPASTLRIAILVALGCSNIVAPVYRRLRRRLPAVLGLTRRGVPSIQASRGARFPYRPRLCGSCASIPRNSGCAWSTTRAALAVVNGASVEATNTASALTISAGVVTSQSYVGFGSRLAVTDAAHATAAPPTVRLIVVSNVATLNGLLRNAA